jgi:hypothetical protein
MRVDLLRLEAAVLAGPALVLQRHPERLQLVLELAIPVQMLDAENSSVFSSPSKEISRLSSWNEEATSSGIAFAKRRASCDNAPPRDLVREAEGLMLGQAAGDAV